MEEKKYTKDFTKTENKSYKSKGSCWDANYNNEKS